jgi:hypothetical protein
MAICDLLSDLCLLLGVDRSDPRQMPASFHEMGAETFKRAFAPQPVFMRYKLFDIHHQRIWRVHV